jgi:hypothetical protein
MDINTRSEISALRTRIDNAAEKTPGYEMIRNFLR